MGQISFYIILFVLIIFNFSLAQDTLFVETFKDGLSENTWYPAWNQGGNGQIFVPAAWQDNPSGDGWVGELTTVRPDSANLGASFSGDPTWSDYYYEAKLYLPIGGLMGLDYRGLEFRVDSTGGTTKAYQLTTEFRSMTPRMRFRKRTSESPNDFVNIKIFSAEEIPGGIPSDSAWHKVGVKAVGNEFWFYLNGQELPGCPYTDTTSTPLLTNGMVGTYSFIQDFMGAAVPENSLFVDDIIVANPVVGITENNPEALPAGFLLHQNYPNPFNPSTTIIFDLPSAELVTLEIYNNLGEKIRTLTHLNYPAGNHQVTWDGKTDSGIVSPAGIYYYKIRAGEFTQTNKMLMVK
jgi:hypothetical protein